MHKKNIRMKKLIAFVVLICIIVTIFLTTEFLYSYADHKCVGEDCVVCIQIGHCLKVLKTIKELNWAAFHCIVFTSLLYFTYSKKIYSRIKENTPVGLKVRLNN